MFCWTIGCTWPSCTFEVAPGICMKNVSLRGGGGGEWYEMVGESNKHIQTCLEWHCTGLTTRQSNMRRRVGLGGGGPLPWWAILPSATHTTAVLFKQQHSWNLAT